MNNARANIKKITALAAAAAVSAGMSLTAYAKDAIYSREELVDEFWTQYWDDTAPGEENAEGSLEYHILDEWLNEQYPHTWYEDPHKYTVYDWSNYTNISGEWRDYHKEYVENWHYNDEDGEFTIESWNPETEETGGLLYRFEFVNGQWRMIDADGKIVDSFDPHGGVPQTDDSSEEEKEKPSNSYGTVINDGSLSVHYHGQTYYIYNDNNDTLHNMDKNLYDAYRASDDERFSELLEEYGATDDPDDSSHYNYEGEVAVSGEFRTNPAPDSGSASTARVTGRVLGEELKTETAPADPESAANLEDESDNEEADKDSAFPTATVIAGAAAVAAAVTVVVRKKK